MKTCPACNRAFAPDVNVGGPKRQLIYDYIAKHPEGVSNSQIMGAVYADDINGGPISTNIIAVQVCHINKYLERTKAAVRVRGRGGPGSVYRIVWK